MDSTTLETPRLILRRFTEADAPLIYQLNSDPDVTKYTHEYPLRDEDDARQVLINIILPQYRNNLGRLAVHTKSDNQFIGWCGLKWLEASNETDLGYRFHRFAWGKGYATEAAQHALDYGFYQLGLTEIIGKAHVENTGSIKVLKKIGMQFIKEAVEDNCPIKIFHAVSRLNNMPVPMASL